MYKGVLQHKHVGQQCHGRQECDHRKQCQPQGDCASDTQGKIQAENGIREPSQDGGGEYSQYAFCAGYGCVEQDGETHGIERVSVYFVLYFHRDSFFECNLSVMFVLLFQQKAGLPRPYHRKHLSAIILRCPDESWKV